MTPAQRLAAHPKWRWAPGMLVGSAREVAAGGDDLVRIVRVHADADGRPDAVGLGFLQRDTQRNIPPWADFWTEVGDVPVLSDPATVGCVLAMLPLGWTLGTAAGAALIPSPRAGAIVQGATVGEVIALALLAAWGEP